MKSDLIQPVLDRHRNYLTDESKEEGHADSISFPVCDEDICEILSALPDEALTYQGANTGVEGLAVPHGGHIMNFSRMNRILEIGTYSDTEGFAVVEPGVTLDELSHAIRRTLKKNPFFWPPNPTEVSASIGGIAATGAYGMNSYHYGATAQYITALSYAARDGQLHILCRDTEEQAEELDRFLSSVQKPGPITQLTLRLLPKPESVWGVAFFFGDRDEALACADELQNYCPSLDEAWVESMEYLDEASVRLVENAKESIAKLRSIPPVPEDTKAMIITEIAGEEDSIEAVLMELMEITAGHGSDPDEAWALTGESETGRLHDFRHAAAEAVILHIEKVRREYPQITKLGAKSQSYEKPFSQAMQALYTSLEHEQLAAAVYCHIKNSDIEMNLLPQNDHEYHRGRTFIHNWTQN